MRKLVILAVLLANSCVTAPSSPFVALEVFPAIKAVWIRQATQFVAANVDSNGRRSPVRASWSSTPADIGSIDSQGVFIGLAYGVATVSATSADGSASRNVAVVQDYSGLWTGQVRVATCRRQQGSGSDYCRFRRGAVFPTRLILTQREDIVSGRIELDDTLGRPSSAGEITGTSTPSGGLVLGGKWQSLEEGDRNVHVLRTWSTAEDDAGRMVGTFMTEHTMTNSFGPQIGIEEYTLVNMTRVSATADWPLDERGSLGASRAERLKRKRGA